MEEERKEGQREEGRSKKRRDIMQPVYRQKGQGEEGMKGNYVAFTGKMIKYQRNHWERKIKEMGGQIHEEVGISTTHLIVGKDQQGRREIESRNWKRAKKNRWMDTLF